ncbi:hypothetical protein [Streptomyces sp. TRM68367]|uniref:hypothetical protein n=1 Tax=Streptomyces sp. TRM68367 TaxID=2758415 RepID=UPI00165CBAA3|nr:hypothetical protein [Streptomyces sp. TRM68367]MBC9724253.1 hypothetical protein [Streptomyces sp. TRM68367]
MSSPDAEPEPAAGRRAETPAAGPGPDALPAVAPQLRALRRRVSQNGARLVAHAAVCDP